ncbi:uncharacterized protein LOC132930169 [Rhopalosiphum padi]|uniref:uncharacterized protein LOC132930169 n=1 Tax=Rhopalosiphum padi TaxID=40932 RepID=UPI00298E31E3|nr:uncharacterized protein LOC132930169 [Rhopalosiphum padi]
MKGNFKYVCRYFSRSSIDITPEVKNALNNRKPVIALESALITHGLPYPKNVETALEMEHIIKSHNIIPATIGIINGRVKAGMCPEQINVLGMPAEKKTIKVSRRDFPFVLSQGLNGGTTVSGTLVIANALGIKFFVTGGIGGVHIDGQNSLDISADLFELSRCAIMVVSAGIKSILDIGRTLEYLETVGVCVASYDSNGEFPAFYTKLSGYQSVCNVTSPYEAAGLLEQCQNTGSGVLLAVPILEEKIKKTEIDKAIENARQMCEKQGIVGKSITPFVLSEVSRLTKGLSMETNISLLKNNSLIGSKIALEYYSKLSSTSKSVFEVKKSLKKSKNSPVVIGGSNVDYVLQVDEDLKLDGRMLAGQMKRVSGGVGRNIADALGRFGHDVCFLSAVGDDSNGDAIIKSLDHINTDKIVVAGDQSTSWCVVFQDRHGDCMACIGDMECHKRISIDLIKKNIDSLYQSPLVVIDGNVCPETMEFVIGFCNEENIPVYFETTDIAVASKPFYSDMWKALSFMSPNLKELQEISKKLPAEVRVNYAIKVSINGSDEFDTRDRIMNSSKDIVCKLISHIPVIMVTLGDKGLLLASRQSDDTVSLVHYPAQKIETPVSASGAGDCLCAGYISGVLQGKSQDECVAMGLKAATSALLSHRPVPIELNVN